MRTASELISIHLSHIGKPVSEQDQSIYSPNIVAEFPYAPDGHTTKLEGPEAVGAFLARIATFARDIRIGEPKIHETPTGAIAEYHGDSVFTDTNLPYSQDYIVVFTVVDGQFAHFREYYDGLRVLKAIGELS